MLTLVSSISPSEMYGQSEAAAYTFNGCSLNDETGNHIDANTIFFPSCDCGLVTDGMYFDGNDDFLTFPSTIDSLMQADFTLSFYFRLDQVNTQTDILSVRAECALDSFLAITYNPLTNTISLELAQRIGNIQTEEVLLDSTVCWHRLVLTKSELVYSLYLDDKLAVSILTDGIINFNDNARLSLSNSPCLAVNVDKFNGWIDEFIFYDRALSGIELSNNSLNPDKVLTNDTTIIAGSEVQINVGTSCSTSFDWNPSVFLDDATVLDPIATPDKTTTYNITFNYSGCSTSDSITIHVIDPDALDCSTVFIPNAFTPNGDLLNDTYGISSLFMIDELDYFEIYDRWGGKMWSASNKNDAWDGTFKGKRVNPGMYMYKIKYTCGDQEYVNVNNFSILR